MMRSGGGCVWLSSEVAPGDCRCEFRPSLAEWSGGVETALRGRPVCGFSGSRWRQMFDNLVGRDDKKEEVDVEDFE